MSSNDDQLQREIEIIDSVAGKGKLEKARAYTKLTGPGWLQGAITLGGGSLAGALYLGTISGYKLMWVQPLAMICGIIMLSAIAYVTLSTGQRPFGAINRHLSPLLGWSWLVATIMANIVWCMPQFNLGRAAIQQNLIPGIGEGTGSTVVICAVLLVVALAVNASYEAGTKGLKNFERILKSMVAVVVVSFFLVVVALSLHGALPWGEIFGGFFPNFSYLFKAPAVYEELISASSNPSHWQNLIVGEQRNRIMTAFATAVGINMTFLLPYSMLRKRWGEKHRGLAIFDLSIGLLIPYVLATGCVIIAAASQFHAQTEDILEADGNPKKEFAAAHTKLLSTLPAVAEAEDVDGTVTEVSQSAAIADLPQADRELGAMLVARDNLQLANALQPLAGKYIAQLVFGIGVLGMALSTIIILMLINGFAFQELFGHPGSKPLYFMGCLVSGFAGAAGPFIYTGDAKAYLAVPTSVIGGSLIPIAYFTFLLLMNSRSTLGDRRPTGAKRIWWNVLMVTATAIATFGSVWVLLGMAAETGFRGTAALCGLIFLVLLFAYGTLSFVRKERQLSTKS